MVVEGGSFGQCLGMVSLWYVGVDIGCAMIFGMKGAVEIISIDSDLWLVTSRWRIELMMANKPCVEAFGSILEKLLNYTGPLPVL